MAQERSVIKFIRPCLSIHEDKKILTSEYCWQSLNKKRAVQINLDNCSRLLTGGGCRWQWMFR